MRAALIAAIMFATAPAVAQTVPLPAKIDAPSGHYELDPAHASVLWRIKHMGLEEYTAKFTKIAGTVDYDAGDPTKSKLDVTIDANSVHTDFPYADKKDFDAEIRGFLSAAKNPKIHFVSRSIVKTGPNQGIVTGDLTLNGITKTANLNATWDGAILMPFPPHPPVFGISATGLIDRTAYGVTAMAPMIGETVDIRIEAEFDKK